jgi:hypothetical protein
MEPMRLFVEVFCCVLGRALKKGVVGLTESGLNVPPSTLLLARVQGSSDVNKESSDLI